jgi:phenylacetate-CoA ligase
VERISHEDVLTVRMEPRASSINTISTEEAFRKIFRDICTVNIDHMEHVEQGTLKDDERLIVDERTWK